MENLNDFHLYKYKAAVPHSGAERFLFARRGAVCLNEKYSWKRCYVIVRSFNTVRVDVSMCFAANGHAPRRHTCCLIGSQDDEILSGAKCLFHSTLVIHNRSSINAVLELGYSPKCSSSPFDCQRKGLPPRRCLHTYAILRGYPGSGTFLGPQHICGV